MVGLVGSGGRIPFNGGMPIWLQREKKIVARGDRWGAGGQSQAWGGDTEVMPATAHVSLNMLVSHGALWDG